MARAHPLGSLSKKDRWAFLETLSPAERERYELAVKWYERTYRAPSQRRQEAAAYRDLLRQGRPRESRES